MGKSNGKNGKPKDGDKASKTVRDRNGQYLKGTAPGPGRPKGIEFVAAVRRWAKENDVDLEQAAGELAEALHERGLKGDTAAAKLWLDRCCGLQKQELEVNSTAIVLTADDAKDQILKAIGEGGQASLHDRLRERGD